MKENSYTDPKRGREVSNDRRSFLAATLVGIAGAGGLVSCSSLRTSSKKGFAMTQKKGIYPDGAPAADAGYSPAIMASGEQLLFISGQGPKDVNADMETQMRQTFDRIGLILTEAGASWKNVVIMRSFFVHLLRDLPIYRKVRRDYLVEPYPASTAVGTTELAIPGLEIEIEAVAIL